MPNMNIRDIASLRLNLVKNLQPYCDCHFPTSTQILNHDGFVPDLVDCHCGEEEASRVNWQWHHDSESDVQIKGNDIVFHPVYSQGTAVVRGDKPLKEGMIHFWEMRVLTVLTGTDVMIGIGTQNKNLNEFKNHFVSALGTNTQSWGYSYAGKIQHNGELKNYGKKFCQGCLIGVFLDRCRGHLEFFLNRRSLGIAYTNIPTDASVEIYPMVTATPAKCSIRLVSSSTLEDSLQFRTFQAIARHPKQLEHLRKIAGYRNIIRDFWFLAPPPRYSKRSKVNEFDIFDEAVLSSKARRRKKKKCLDSNETNVDDIYADVYKFVVENKNESDDDNCSMSSECNHQHKFLL